MHTGNQTFWAPGTRKQDSLHDDADSVTPSMLDILGVTISKHNTVT